MMGRVIPGSGGGHSDTIRRAESADSAAVADLLIRARRAAVAFIPAPVHTDDEIREWVREVVIPEREVWLVVAAEGQVLAVMVLHEDWVDQLYVDPERTGGGLGSRLIELAKARRPDGLQLWTFASNVGAQRFYEQHGFVGAERTDGSGNEEGQPDMRYVWAGPTGPRPDRLFVAGRRECL